MSISRIRIKCPQGCECGHDAYYAGGNKWKYRCPASGPEAFIFEMTDDEMEALEAIVRLAYEIDTDIEAPK